MATITQPYIRDASPESYQVRPESLEAFEPSYASSKVKKENDAIRNRISDFAKATYFSTKHPINKPAMNNRRLLIAAVFHFVHPVEKDSQKHHKLTENSVSFSYQSEQVSRCISFKMHQFSA